MSKRILCIALAAATLAPAAAFASHDEGEWYFAPRLGWADSDDDRFADNTLLLGLGVGYRVNSNLAIDVELAGNRFPGDNAFDQDWKVRTLGVTGRYSFGDGDVHPYLGLGLGAGWNRYDLPAGDIDDWGLMANVVGGVEWHTSDNWAVRAEIGYRHTDINEGPFDESFGDVIGSLGVVYAFGGGGSAPVEPASPPPAPPTPPPPPPAPADSDGDGVLDPNDKCPNTPAGTMVDRDGCPVPVSIDLRGVNFDFDKCTLRADAIAILDEAVRVLSANPIKVEVAGHTDAVGSDAYNQKLSECRAKVVAEYLGGKGVAGDRITGVNGYGEGKPIDTNDTAEGRARNRRTELNIQ